MSIKKDLFIGLDLSYNSTGMCFMLVDKKLAIPEKLRFEILLFDKYYENIQGVNQNIYHLPKNITKENLSVLSEADRLQGEWYQEDQINLTLKYSIASLNIIKIVKDIVEDYENKYDVDKIFIAIEGVIESNSRNVQFRHLTGLIMLQGYVRTELIRHFKTKMKLNIESPTTLKKFFTDNGKADKFLMVKKFQEKFDGDKLIDCSSVAKINDVVDAFALVSITHYKINYPLIYNALIGELKEIKQQKYKERKSKKTKKIKTECLIQASLPKFSN